MRVSHLCKTDSDGGAAKAAYRLHDGLVRHGVNSSFVVDIKSTTDSTVFGPKSHVEKLWARAVGHLDRSLLRFNPTKTPGLRSLNWLGTGAFNRAVSMKPDILHLHWIASGLVRLEKLRKIQVPVVWRLPDMWPFLGLQHYATDDSRWLHEPGVMPKPAAETGIDLDQWVYSRKQRVYRDIQDLTLIAPSRWMKTCIEKSFLFKDRPVEWIPTGQNLEVYRPIEQNIARQVLRLPETKKLILFGAINAMGDPRKGSDLLDAAIKEIAQTQESQNIEFVVFGSPKQRGQQKIHGLNTHFLGELHDDTSLSLAYAAADVFVAPSREENLANTVIESLACGTPVVAFNIGGMPDAVIAGKSGWLIEPFRIESLTRALLEAVQLPSEARNKIRESSRLHAINHFSIDRQCQATLALYESILEKKRAP